MLAFLLPLATKIIKDAVAKIPENEETKYDRYDAEKKKFAKADSKMKFGKFMDKAKEAKGRLRPGEVKRYDKNLGRYVSNKE